MEKYIKYLCALALIIGFPLQLYPNTLKPYKDKLFAYPSVLETEFNGDFLRFDYRKDRDLHERDQVSGSRVKSFYISRYGRRVQQNLELKLGDKYIEYSRVGRTKNIDWIIFYLHGQGGDRSQGMNDWSFGGNFNRLKNLVIRNKGLYITPTVQSFDQEGAKHISVLIHHYAKRFPKARLVLACGSIGGQICWQYINGSIITPRISGVFMLGAFADGSFLDTDHVTGSKPPIPLVFAHGTEDSVFPWQQTYTLFKTLKTIRHDYPVRLRVFETGSHGTPIRMIDWRLEINWALSQ